mmetsp:Transcript_4649/g.15488  ORF Transcript_4649/g.15488 Transcript_4649/m.15488 type:complete len:229 (-) Transcript_4649:249-935(-)
MGTVTNNATRRARARINRQRLQKSTLKTPRVAVSRWSHTVGLLRPGIPTLHKTPSRTLLKHGKSRPSCWIRKPWVSGKARSSTAPRTNRSRRRFSWRRRVLKKSKRLKPPRVTPRWRSPVCWTRLSTATSSRRRAARVAPDKAIPEAKPLMKASRKRRTTRTSTQSKPRRTRRRRNWWAARVRRARIATKMTRNRIRWMTPQMSLRMISPSWTTPSTPRPWSRWRMKK